MNTINEQKKKIFLITSEESGATIGALLMKRLKKEFNDNVEFYGIGGTKMCDEGLNMTYNIKDISYMGIFEVARHINQIVDILIKTEQQIRELQPDAVISIDSQDFSKRLFQRIKDFQTLKFQYVAPSVWAWRKNRAKQLKGLIDYIFTLFPFENKFFEKYGIKTYCVGHNIIENNLLFNSDEQKSSEILQGIIKDSENPNTKIISILPGSRISEVRRHLPIIANSLKLLSKQFSDLKIFMPVTETTKKYIENHIKIFKNKIKPILIYDEQIKYELFKKSDLAIAASGTVALELGISETPAIIIYKVNWLTAFIVKHMIKIPNVCLVNILMNKNIYPELLQQNAYPKKIFEIATELLTDKGKINQMKDNLERFRNYILSGNRHISPTEKAAQIIAEAISAKNPTNDKNLNENIICDKGDD